MSNDLRESLVQLYKSKTLLTMYKADGTYAYTAHVSNIVDKRVFIIRYSDTEICCGNKKKKYREFILLDSISKVDGDKVYLC